MVLYKRKSMSVWNSRLCEKHWLCIFVLYHPISRLEVVNPNPERVKPVKLHQQMQSERVRRCLACILCCQEEQPVSNAVLDLSA